VSVYGVTPPQRYTFIKNNGTQALVRKLMATVFWDVVGVIHMDFFKPGTVIS
jgi:hypothetical protein